MKNLASAKEERERVRKNKVNHGEFSLKRRSLWFIIFIGIISLLISADYYSSSVFSLEAQRDTLFSLGQIRRITLDNGMVVLLKENRNLPLVSLFLCVLTGSAQEGKLSAAGISHFIEHMVFKGTATRKVGDIFREIESYGGKINAFTSYDYTGYKITVPREFVFPALEILADMAANAAFNEGELKKERQVVLKEIRLKNDNPQSYASRLLWQNAYSIHSYKYPILGEEHLFKRLSRKDLVQFYQTRYAPNNMVLAVVGDVETEKAQTFIKDIFKDFRQKPIPNFASEPEPEQKELRKQEEKFTAGLTYLLLGFHSVAITDEDCYALDILGTILGEGESSRLYKLICDKKRLAYSIGAINYTPREPGLLIISCLLEERHRRRVQSLILDQIRLIKKKKITKDELESAKNKVISDVLFYNQTIEAQAQELALNEGITGDFRFTEKYIQEIRQVNPQDVLRVANKYLLQNRLNIVALIPRDESVKSNLPGSSGKRLRIGIENLSRETRDNAPINPERYLLDNGLTLLVRENKGLPLVSIKAVFKGGLRTEDADINGLCNLVAQMLDKGTKTLDASEIAHLVESKGARLSSFSGNNSFGISLDLLSRDFDPMLALFADLIINPTFAQREFKRLKEKNLAGLKTFEDNIFDSGIKLLKSTLFQKHPYGFLTIGNKESLKKLRRRDLINFYQDFCVGKNMVLAVFGDVNAREVLLKVKKHFANLKSGDIARIAPKEEPQTKAVRTSSKILPKKQSLLLMGFYGTTVFSRDRYALEVICQVLTQSSGRLFTRIREKAGLAYTLGAYSVLGLDPGYLVIYVATTHEFIETVKKEILQQLRLLKVELLSDKELAQAKRALIGKKMISRQTNSACALESSLDELYGLGYDRYLKYSQQIKRIKAEDIRECANRYFDLNNYALAVVGADSAD